MIPPTHPRARLFMVVPPSLEHDSWWLYIIVQHPWEIGTRDVQNALSPSNMNFYTAIVLFWVSHHHGLRIATPCWLLDKPEVGVITRLKWHTQAGHQRNNTTKLVHNDVIILFLSSYISHFEIYVNIELFTKALKTMKIMWNQLTSLMTVLSDF